VEWLKVKALSSNPSTKKTPKNKNPKNSQDVLTEEIGSTSSSKDDTPLTGVSDR
jgi:hypothetical protein